MRHRKRGRKLSRDCDHRASLKRNLLNQLFTHERIVTTVAKAKEFRPAAEKIITMARKAHAIVSAAKTKEEKAEAQRKNLHYFRLAMKALGKQHLFDRDGDPVLTPNDWPRSVIHKLFEDLGPRFASRPGGYTRILRLPNKRLGDKAEQVVWELIPDGAVASSKPDTDAEDEDTGSADGDDD
jgi:large subunit ribosomal protein L17